MGSGLRDERFAGSLNRDTTVEGSEPPTRPGGAPASLASGARSGLLGRECHPGWGRPLAALPVLAFVALALCVSASQAQTAVCNNTPANNERISCTEDSASTSDIDIDLTDVAISTTGEDEHGIAAEHAGTGGIEIDVTGVPGTDTITTSGPFADAIQARHSGTGDGDVTVNLTDISIFTSGENSMGLTAIREDTSNASQDGSGDVSITVTRGRIETTNADTLTIGINLRNVVPGEGDASLTLRDSAVMTRDGPGISAVYGLGVGDLTIDIGGSSITTQDSGSPPIAANFSGTGSIDIDVWDNTALMSAGNSSDGIQASIEATGSGDISIDLKSGSSIVTSGVQSRGVYSRNSSSTGGHIRIGLSNASITTEGAALLSDRNVSQGIIGWSLTTGNVEVSIVNDSRIVTEDVQSDGVYVRHEGSGDVLIDLNSGSSITTRGRAAHGIHGEHHHDDGTNSGDVRIEVSNAAITTESSGMPDERISSHGIHGYNNGTGDIIIDVRNGSIETAGTDSYGVYARHLGDGDIDIATHGSQSIATTGPNGHGIVAHHHGTEDSRRIAIEVGGNLVASGVNAQGIRVGAGNADDTDTVPDGTPERVAAIGADGYRQQTVTINGSVKSNAEGVFLAGGGKVVIGPRGSIASDSGIAILATGDTPGASPGDPGTAPKLRVDLNTRVHSVAEALGDDWILNDGGETTIAVNGVVLHDGATGVVPGAVATSGARNVTMQAQGVTVNRSDPANWVISYAAEGVVADRDFSAAAFIEEFAPRAAVYEALPGFLLRLNEEASLGERRSSPGRAMWGRLTLGSGSHEAERATVGAEYDHGRVAVEAGLDVSFGENAKGVVSVHSIRGSADVTSPVRGGEMGAEGIGLSLGVSLGGASAYYASGRFSHTDYTVDLSSDGLGSLETGVGARASSLGLEAGARMDLSEEVNLTPRVRLSRSAVDVDDFTDAVDSRVSVGDATRIIGSLGAAAETEQVRKWHGGAVSLRGSLDLAQTLSGEETSVNVSGERLSTDSDRTRLLLGLGGTYRRGEFSLNADVAASGLGTNDVQYAGQVTFGWGF